MLKISPSKSTYVVGDRIKCESNGYPRPKLEWIGIESGDKRNIDGEVLEVNDKMIGNNKWKCKACQNSNSLCKEEEISFKVVKSTSGASHLAVNFSIILSFLLLIYNNL